ncbi:hypothetical protein BKN38_05905 [Helicobacter sp. CLO-3]|uniref:hypothetical protein n=1 Tax=unclassified Helicobacter TaxID=2593540 RepID=UPI000805EC75|nr:MULTISPECIES: hypothetical protein [unclassified Helicobacter]OBV29495.1 hypothetical protein BA723_05465 [Helicobacter sp. CLO-3]OHU83071.1 hypothetical protein BKN38_05905 [Helicobacter sp. CLO-3]
MDTKKASENLNAIRQEFQQDEKILENAFRLERLFRKYKYWIIAVVALIVIWGAYAIIYDTLREKKAQEISALYDELVQNPNNEVLRKSLQEKAPELYDLYALKLALESSEPSDALRALKDSQNPIVKQIAEYELASIERKGLEAIKGAFGDFAKVQEAYLLLSSGQIPQARAILTGIGEDSAMFGVASQMRHFGIKDYPLESDMKIQEVPAGADSGVKVDSGANAKAGADSGVESKNADSKNVDSSAGLDSGADASKNKQ